MATAMTTGTTSEQAQDARAPETYEPPALVKHGSLSELTLMPAPVSGGGGPWGKKHHKGHWGA